MHLRPLEIGDSLRRIAARCFTLQTKGDNSASVGMSQEFQCGVGMQGGVDDGYTIPNRALVALVKADIPSAMLLTDAGNAYCSIMKDAAIEEVLRVQRSWSGLGLLVVVVPRHRG